MAEEIESLQMKTKTLKVNGKPVVVREVFADSQEKILDLLNSLAKVEENTSAKDLYAIFYEILEIGTGMTRPAIKAAFSIGQMQVLVQEVSAINGIGGGSKGKKG